MGIDLAGTADTAVTGGTDAAGSVGNPPNDACTCLAILRIKISARMLCASGPYSRGTSPPSRLSRTVVEVKPRQVLWLHTPEADFTQLAKSSELEKAVALTSTGTSKGGPTSMTALMMS
eukprot:4840073-Amphidinium_carterae.5